MSKKEAANTLLTTSRNANVSFNPSFLPGPIQCIKLLSVADVPDIFKFCIFVTLRAFRYLYSPRKQICYKLQTKAGFQYRMCVKKEQNTEE